MAESPAAVDAASPTRGTPAVLQAASITSNEPAPTIEVTPGLGVGSPSPLAKNLSLQDLHDQPANLKGDETLRVEVKLQQNLKKQQENYARQRKLLEDLQRGDHPEPSQSLELSSVSSSSTCSNLVREATSSVAKQPTTPQLTSSTLQSDWKQSSSMMAESFSPPLPLAALKGRAILQTKSTSQAPPSRRNNFLEEFQQQEASNDALRKQLELLRRLQLENNRFRHENRSLREERALFEQQNKLLQGEKVRAHEEIILLTQTLQQQQVKLAASAQTTKKFKHCSRQVHQLQQENAKLESALQDTLSKQQEIHDQVDQELQSLLNENKKLKRTLRTEKALSKQQEQDKQVLRGTIDNLESQLLELDQRGTSLSTQKAALELEIKQKAKQCESIEHTASDCVQRIETNLNTVQRAYTSEREKRKKLDELVNKLKLQLTEASHAKESLERQIETMGSEMKSFSRETQSQIETLKAQKAQSESNLQNQRDKSLELNELVATLRQQVDQRDQKHQKVEHQMTCLRMELTQETKKLRREVDHLRNYLEQSLKQQSGDSVKASGSSGGLGSMTIDPSPPMPPIDESSSVEHTQTASMMHLIAQSHEDNWLKSAELQYLQANIASLRNEVLNFVNEFHRCRHMVRSQNQKLVLANERVAELEQLRGQDALQLKELRDKQHIAEQARDISSKEKLEVLKWSQETCDKNESLQQQVAKCADFFRKVLNHLQMLACDDDQLLRAIDWHESAPQHGSFGAATTSAAAAVLAAGQAGSGTSSIDPLPWIAPLEQQIQYFVTTRSHLFEKLQHQLQEQQEQKHLVAQLQHEMQIKVQEKDRVMQEIEQLHQQTLVEQKQLYESSLGEADQEKIALEATLKLHQQSQHTLQQQKDQLDQAMRDQQQDLATLESILHVFVVVLRPFLLQVSDLLAQKRLLVRENAELMDNQREIECIGQVLKELVPLHGEMPTGSGGGGGGDVGPKSENPGGDTELELSLTLEQIEIAAHARKKKFRRVLISVFAANRFRRVLRNAKWTGVCESVLSRRGGAQPLLARPRIEASVINGAGGLGSADPVVIKVLPLTSTLSKLNLRDLLSRFRQLELSQKMAQLVERSSSTSSSSSWHSDSSSGTVAKSHTGVAGLLLQILAVIDEAQGASNAMTELLMDNLIGAFHCQALVRRQASSKRSKTSSSTSTIRNNLSSGDFIRKRLLALGKRLEDLQYQRNSLQEDNYEMQFQLEQQRVHLGEMESLTKTTNDFKTQLDALRTQQQQDAVNAQDQVAKLTQEADQKLQQILHLQNEKAQLAKRLEELQCQHNCDQSEKEALHEKLRNSTENVLEETQKLALLKMTLAKNQVEITNLKQAARQAHELVQQTSRRLEREVEAKAALQKQFEEFRRQKDQIQKTIQQEQKRELENSLELLNQSFEASQSGSVSVGDVASLSASGSCNFGCQSMTSSPAPVPFTSPHTTPVTMAMPTPVTPSHQRQPQPQQLQLQSKSLPVTPIPATTTFPSVSFTTPPTSRFNRRAPQSPDGSLEPNGFNFVQVKKADEVTKRVNELLRELQKENPHQQHRVTVRRVRNAYDREDGFEQLEVVEKLDDTEYDDENDSEEIVSDQHRFKKTRPVHSLGGNWKDDSPTTNSIRLASALNDETTIASRSLEISRNRHQIDIDKVNSAVHDYMDKIDEKLHKMYGIPHSNRWQKETKGQQFPDDGKCESDE